MQCMIDGGALKRVAPYTFKSKVFRSVYSDRSVYECRTCGLKQANVSRVDDAALTRYYQQDYRTASVAIAQSTSEAADAYYEARASALLGLAMEHFSGTPDSVFEVGAGYGYNLIAFGQAFPQAKLYTDEPSKVVNRPSVIETRSLSEGPYDIIVMSHVVEHFTDPVDLLSKALGSLTSKGLIVIEVPNDVGGIVTINGPDEPHLSFFTKPTLEALLGKVRGKVLALYTAGPSYQPLTLKKRVRTFLVETAAKLPVTSRIIAKGRERTARQALATGLDFSQKNERGNVLRAVLTRS